MTQETKTLKSASEILEECRQEYFGKDLANYLSPSESEYVLKAMLAYHNQYYPNYNELKEHGKKLLENTKGGNETIKAVAEVWYDLGVVHTLNTIYPK